MTLSERVLRIEKLLGIVPDDTVVSSLPPVFNIDERTEKEVTEKWMKKHMNN